MNALKGRRTIQGGSIKKRVISSIEEKISKESFMLEVMLELDLVKWVFLRHDREGRPGWPVWETAELGLV